MLIEWECKTTMLKEFTIVVNSCDKYECAWDPFFKLLKINWPQCENHKIILNTETKEYNCDFLDVTSVCGGDNVTWSARLKAILEKIDTEIVLFFLEDFFLQEKVNQDMFNEALQLISEDDSVGYIGLKYSSERVFADKNFIPGERFFSRDLLATTYRITAMSVLWKKDWLIELLNEKENAWEFEVNASVRSKKYLYKVLEINNLNGVCPPVFTFEDKIKYGYGITQGQWLPKNKELFERFGIDADFSTIGINYKLYEQANEDNAPNKPKKNALMNPIEIIYNWKKRIFNKK